MGEVEDKREGEKDTNFMEGNEGEEDGRWSKGEVRRRKRVDGEMGGWWWRGWSLGGYSFWRRGIAEYRGIKGKEVRFFDFVFYWQAIL